LRSELDKRKFERVNSDQFSAARVPKSREYHVSPNSYHEEFDTKVVPESECISSGLVVLVRV